MILSQAFFGHGWRECELDRLVAREQVGGEQLMLPVWHGVASADVVGFSPSLAARLARSTSQFSLEQIAAEIALVARR